MCHDNYHHLFKCLCSMLISLSNVSNVLQNGQFPIFSLFWWPFFYNSNGKIQIKTRFTDLDHCSNKLIKLIWWKAIFIFWLHRGRGGEQNSFWMHVALWFKLYFFVLLHNSKITSTKMNSYKLYKRDLEGRLLSFVNCIPLDEYALNGNCVCNGKYKFYAI